MPISTYYFILEMHSCTLLFVLMFLRQPAKVAVAIDRKVIQTFKITHDVFVFNQLNTLIMQLDTFPDIVFEATGVYSRGCKAFLEAHNYPYTYLTKSFVS